MSFVPAYVDFLADGATPARCAFLLHGIMGSERNWRGFARRFADRFPSWHLVVVDLRNHGASRDAPPPHDLDACVGDLERLGEHLAPPDAVIGHSFGGKVALAYAERHGSKLDATWVLDGPPGDEPDTSHTEVGRLVASLREIRLPVKRRQEVARHLAAAGFSPGLSGWMATNLQRDEADGYRWHFDLDGVAALLEDYWQQDLHRVLTESPGPSGVHLVYAEDSDRWRPEQLVRLRELAAEGRLALHRLPDAGHWVHVDNPDGLLDILATTFGQGDAPRDP